MVRFTLGSLTARLFQVGHWKKSWVQATQPQDSYLFSPRVMRSPLHISVFVQQNLLYPHTQVMARRYPVGRIKVRTTLYAHPYWRISITIESMKYWWEKEIIAFIFIRLTGPRYPVGL